MHNIYGSWARLGFLFNNWDNFPGVLEGAFFFFGLPFMIGGFILWIVYKMAGKFIEQETYGQLKNIDELEKEIKLLQQQRVP